MRSFLALHDIEFNSVVFLQALVSVRSNCAVVNKNIRAIVSPEKTETLGIVEPLHYTLLTFHVLFLAFSYMIHLDEVI